MTMESKFVNGVSLSGLQDIYADFDSYLVAHRKRFKKRSPYHPAKPIQSHGSPHRHLVAMDDSCHIPILAREAMHSAMLKTKWRPNCARTFSDDEHFANNYYVMIKLYNNGLRNKFREDFKSKL